MTTHSTLQKLNPWNWFKHEEPHASDTTPIPVKKGELTRSARHLDSPMSQFHREIDRLFEDTFQRAGFGGRLPRLFENNEFRPDLNLASEDDKYILTLEAPGMSEGDISIEVKDDILTIKGDKLEEKEDKDKHYYRMERRYGAFQRVLALPSDVQADNIEASMKHGVLTIELPRSALSDEGVKKIPISQ